MADFLLELRCEEIPARMQAGARKELDKLFRREMEAAGVAIGELIIWSTPRRLALIARDLPKETDAVREEAKGPPVGAPDQAVDGFCRKNGVTRDQLEEREVKGRATWFAVIERPGQAVADLLAAAIPTIIGDFSWPKSMRWGDASISSESTRWVRPLSGIVALLDGEVVPCVTDGMASGRVTFGHRFHSDGGIAIDDADDYASRLRDEYVIVDHEERASIIRDGASKAAADAGLKLVEDEGLVIENAGLTEWPVPLLGRFDEAFLDVPPEVIQLTARVNQKYFVCEDADGKLANAFICTANLASVDPAVVVDGNRKVLAARLADARFFWELDQKKTLAEHAKGLERITFHEKLGTVADKVDRVAKLARWLVEEDIVTPDLIRRPATSDIADEKRDPGSGAGVTKEELADLAEQAARLCKADLVTEMVGEFPELQGLMGGYYAEKEGQPQEVSDAIRDHYKPVGQGDEVPTTPVTVAVSLADKMDTLMCFFAIDEKPTGSKDPFALRRAALAVIRTTLENGLRFSVDDTFEYMTAVVGFDRDKSQESIEKQALKDDIASDLFSEIASGRAGLHWFILERFNVQQRAEGIRHDIIEAAFNGRDDDLVRLRQKSNELQAFVETENGTNLLAGYKRAANILKKEEWETKEVSYSPEPAEKALIDALDAAAPKAAAAVSEERFEDAMAALATLRAPIDAFFGGVTVNDDDENKRAARLDLLARFTSAVGQVADFSRIEG
ncbi:glycine--tRNA ligase subunit beta [Erythrobacter sp. KY5]|uniref:glycine--tRNA ligase subunit beta n=1 Tax=Erythrobacter sp. KY5 TaxID=2011159 RepID=UPI000DBF0BBD|nr:glycine--tRNA ligase subunit beta [Erythrobacter sp. KY5]AWW74719.1 glycine--tRNA ligase subunit beta [Erythrobacter sp. KY5]